MNKLSSKATTKSLISRSGNGVSTPAIVTDAPTCGTAKGGVKVVKLDSSTRQLHGAQVEIGVGGFLRAAPLNIYPDWKGLGMQCSHHLSQEVT